MVRRGVHRLHLAPISRRDAAPIGPGRTFVPMHPSDLTSKQRLAVAAVCGAADRLSVGKDKDLPRDEAVAHLQSISADPEVLGEVLAGLLHRIELGGRFQRAVDLLRATDASEERATAKLQWLREQQVRHGGGTLP